MRSPKDIMEISRLLTYDLIIKMQLYWVQSDRIIIFISLAQYIIKPMDFQWHQLTSNNIKYRYKTDLFSDNSMGKRFHRLNHQYMLITVASYGGPIALTSDKSQILTLREDDPSIENIVIFSNQGQIMQQIKLANPFQNVIVHLEFIQDEMLLVLFQRGQQWLINPHSGAVYKYNLIGLLQTEEIKQAKVFQNGFAILTNKNRFLFVRNAYQPQCIQFVSCEEELRFIQKNNDYNNQKRLYWTVFSPKHIISQKIELHLSHPVAGIIQVVEDESKRLFYNRNKADHIIESKLPNIKGITYISELSPNRKLVVYFSSEPIYKENPMEQMAQNMRKKKDKVQVVQKQIVGYTYRLVFGPSLTSDALSSEMFSFYDVGFIKDSHVKYNAPYSIKWCGNKAIIIQFWNQELYMYSINGDYIRIEKQRGQKQKWTYLKQQIDGTRILSKFQNKILRQIPASYISIFESFSQQPGALLYAAYEAFEEEAPLQDDQIRKQKKKLAVGVQQCIKASRFQVKFSTTTRLMKAGTYGKAFLPPNMVQNNLIYDTTKALRIVHSLRHKHRFITFEQFESLNNDMLLKILLRYREHYLAFEIYQYLKKDQNFRIKIYTDWACCKVENRDEDQTTICERIRQKLQDEKGISFTQIAHRAIQIGRSQLALKLLSFEPSLAKKIPLLLWMGGRQQTQEDCYKFYEKALEQSLRSRDLNLLFLAIRKIMTSQRVGRQKVFSMFSSNREGRAALINYFRLFDSKSLVEYYHYYLNDIESVVMEYLKKAFEQKKYETYQALYQCAVQSIKQYDSPMKQDWRKQTIPKLYGHLCQFTNKFPDKKFRKDGEKPVNICFQLQHFLKKKDSGAVNDIKSFYKISDKRVVLGQIKVFIEEGKYEDLETFVQRNQKKYNLPVEMIAQLLFKKRQQTWAMRMMARMPTKNKQQQYLLLQRIGKIRQAIDLAADRKDIDALEDIRSTLLDANLMAYADDKISMIKRR